VVASLQLLSYCSTSIAAAATAVVTARALKVLEAVAVQFESRKSPPRVVGRKVAANHLASRSEVAESQASEEATLRFMARHF